MTVLSAHAAPCFSRRSLLTLLALSPVPVLVSCKGSVPFADAADDQISRVIQAYTDLARREPDLPGLKSLARLYGANLTAGFSASDLSLLTSDLYLKVRQQVETANRPIDESDVRAALSRPINVSPYGRPFLERTLAQARTGASQDFFRRQEGSGTIAFRHRRCEINGEPATGCGWLIVFIILLIILV